MVRLCLPFMKFSISTIRVALYLVAAKLWLPSNRMVPASLKVRDCLKKSAALSALSLFCESGLGLGSLGVLVVVQMFTHVQVMYMYARKWKPL